MAAMDIWIYS